MDRTLLVRDPRQRAIEAAWNGQLGTATRPFPIGKQVTPVSCAPASSASRR